jgi:hypothetical protein
MYLTFGAAATTFFVALFMKLRVGKIKWCVVYKAVTFFTSFIDDVKR